MPQSLQKTRRNPNAPVRRRTGIGVPDRTSTPPEHRRRRGNDAPHWHRGRRQTSAMSIHQNPILVYSNDYDVDNVIFKRLPTFLSLFRFGGRQFSAFPCFFSSFRSYFVIRIIFHVSTTFPLVIDIAFRFTLLAFALFINRSTFSTFFLFRSYFISLLFE